MMQIPISVFLVFAICGSVMAAELPDAALHTIETRLRPDVRADGPVTVLEKSCSSQPANSPISAPNFQFKYPKGVFVVCDAHVFRGAATATVLRYLFDTSRGQALVAEKIRVKLSKRTSFWRVDAWSATTIDNPPPSSHVGQAPPNYSLKRTAASGCGTLQLLAATAA